MFLNSEFNCDINEWNLINVIHMNSMFERNSRFNQDLSKWNPVKVKKIINMFYGAVKFDPENNLNDTMKSKMIN